MTTQVSLYKKIGDVKNNHDVDFSDIMDAIREGKWKDKIQFLKKRISEGASKEEIEEIKSGLPGFTASGIFTHRKAEGLKMHSGKLALDFDGIEHKINNPEEVREVLMNDKYTEYLFTSSSGRGFCIIVNIDPEKHAESFLFIEKYYMDVYAKLSKHRQEQFDKSGNSLGIYDPDYKIDTSCKDVSRVRYISYDENLFHNPEYEPVIVAPEYTSITIDSDEEKYEWIKNVHEKKQQYVEGNRHNYLVILGYFLNKAGVSQDYTASRFSEFVGNGKTQKELDRIVRDCYKNTFEHGVFEISKKMEDLPPEHAKKIKDIAKHAHGMNEAGRDWKENNEAEVSVLAARYEVSQNIVRGILKNVFENNKDSFGFEHKKEIEQVEIFLSKRYKNLVKNVISHRVEYEISPGTFELINNDTILRQLAHAGFKFSLDKVRSLMRSDFVQSFNPIKNYFESLPVWNPETDPDYITQLANYVRTDNQDFWIVQFKKALVRCLACTLDYRENRIIITLVGQTQETGKTTFIRFLCPPALKEYYTETAMNDSKDSDIQLSENMFWNLEELAALHNNEINKLKATISKGNVKQRRTYGEFFESNPRRVNFWASTNKTEFLTDDQNTRWLCFNVLAIDQDYNNYQTGVRNIDINKVWAQAYTLYKSGFDFTLTKEEAQHRDALNKSYELSSEEKDLVVQYFGIVDDKRLGVFHTPTEILLKLQDFTDNKRKLSLPLLKKAMRQLGYLEGYKKIQGTTVRGFYVGIQSSNSHPGLPDPNFPDDDLSPNPSKKLF